MGALGSMELNDDLLMRARIHGRLYSVSKKYWSRYADDPREDQYYRTLKMVQYGMMGEMW